MSRRKLVLANNPLLSGPALDERSRGGIPYREVSIELIDRDSNQPRVHFDEDRLRELSESIKIYGILSPLIVKPSKKQGRFQLVAGERRLRAAQECGLSQVPVLLGSNERSEEDTLALQLVENLQRADLTPLERAHAIGALKETYELSIREVGHKLGISKAMVQRSLEILELPDDLLNALREGASESKVLLLAKIEDEDIRASYLKDLDTLTRSQIKRDLEKGSAKPEPKRDSALSAEDRRIEEELQRSLGLRVRISRSANAAESGRLSVDFYSDDDLQEVFRKLISAE